MTDRPIEPSSYDLAGIPDSVYEWAKWLEDEVDRISASLTQSRAETAAAYERAAQVYIDGDWDWYSDADDAIRALATPEQSSALAAIEAAAEARGMRKAAVIAYQFEGNDKLRCAILAAIPQKDAPQ